MGHEEKCVNDRAVVIAFVSFLGLDIDGFPEDDKDEPFKIDALAGPYAVEHTSIDIAQDQRGHEAQFQRLIGPLEEEFCGLLSNRLSIRMPYASFAIGFPGNEMTDALRRWLRSEAPALPLGTHDVSISGLPYESKVWVKASRAGGVFFSRHAPDDSDVGIRLATVISRKMKKLAPWRTRGYQTLLLIESSDIALMNDDKMAGALDDALRHVAPVALDELWYADTSLPTEYRFLRYSLQLSSA